MQEVGIGSTDSSVCMILVSIQESLLTFAQVRERNLGKARFRLDASLLIARKHDGSLNFSGPTRQVEKLNRAAGD